MVLSVLKPSDSTSTLTMIFLFLANSWHGLLSFPVSEVVYSSKSACLGGAPVLFCVPNLFILYFLSSTGVPKASAEPCSTVSLHPKGAAGHGQGSKLGHLPVLLLLGFIFLVQFIPGLCICFFVHTGTLQFIFKEDKEGKKINSQSDNNPSAGALLQPVATTDILYSSKIERAELVFFTCLLAEAWYLLFFYCQSCGSTWVWEQLWCQQGRKEMVSQICAKMLV